MGWFKKKEETRATLEEILLQAGLLRESITVEEALNIPSVAGCVDIISKIVATIPMKLYREVDGKVVEVKDNRTKLINEDTGDTLDGYQFKKALVEDYLLRGAGYAYINRERNSIKSLHYVENTKLTVNINTDPIFKEHELVVNATPYRSFEFFKLTRKTKDGATGKGIVAESQKMLSVAYNSLIYEETLVLTGGNKKGFLKSDKTLDKIAIDLLKAAWNNLYRNNTENVVVLNKGLEFQEASNTSVEMQLNENKKSNSIEICKLFSMPIGILEGNATKEDNDNFIKNCILPVLKAWETASNKELLLSSEKLNEGGSFYFAADTKELLKGNILERYKAYEIAIKNGFLQWDEVRYIEDYEPYGLDFIKMGLQDVLFNTKTKEIYTPNTDKTTNINNPNKPVEGGEI